MYFPLIQRRWRWSFSLWTATFMNFIKIKEPSSHWIRLELLPMTYLKLPPSYMKEEFFIEILSLRIYWFREIERLNLQILDHAKVIYLESRYSLSTAIYLIYIYSMVPFPLMSINRWILFWKDGYLECRLYSLLALHAISSLSGKRLNWSNFNYFFSYGNSTSKLNVRLF